MKINNLFPLFSLLLLFAFAACNDDDTSTSSYLDLTKQVLTLTEGEATTSTYTFSVEASDATIPYLCLYADKATIDQVPKGELPAYLMEDLRKQAEAKGTPFEQYIASLAQKGSQKDLKVSNLLPGRIYELVVFAVDGTRTADKAEYLFFQTMKTDHVECTFDVNVVPEELQAQSAVFDIKPSNKEVKWYFSGISKSGYDNAIASGSYDDGSILMALLEQELQSIFVQLVPEGGQLTDEIVEQALGMVLHTGDLGLKFTGLSANTDYYWMAGAFTIVSTDDGNEVVLCSDVSKDGFHTPAKDLSKLTFEVEVSDVTAVSAHVKVTPSYTDERYVFFSDAFTDENINMTDEELMNDYIQKNQSNLNMPWGTYVGVQDVPNLSCIPNSKNYVLVFGYSGGPTTAPVVKRFETPAGGDAAKTTFGYENIVATPYQVDMVVVPSDLTVPYVSVLVPDNEFDKEKYIDLIEMQVLSDYNMNVMWNPGMTMTSFIYSNTAYAPGKKSVGLYQGLKEGVSYTVCSFALSPDGKVAAAHEQAAVVTVPGLSDASVSAEILGYFDGDEENGQVFGQPEQTKGRVILAIKYTKSETAKDAWFSIIYDAEEVDEMDPQVLSDEDIIKSYGTPWNELTDSYRFVKCDWDILYYSFAYAKNAQGIEGKVARMVVPAMTKDGAGTIDELKKIYKEGNQETTRSLFRAAMPQFKPQDGAESRTSDVRVPYRCETPAKAAAKQPAGMTFQPTLFPVNGHLPVAHPVRR